MVRKQRGEKAVEVRKAARQDLGGLEALALDGVRGECIAATAQQDRLCGREEEQSLAFARLE